MKQPDRLWKNGLGIFKPKLFATLFNTRYDLVNPFGRFAQGRFQGGIKLHFYSIQMIDKQKVVCFGLIYVPD
jgi:hypothetical protein